MLVVKAPSARSTKTHPAAKVAKIAKRGLWCGVRKVERSGAMVEKVGEQNEMNCPAQTL
jgi:hypothetical protein